MAGEEGSGKKGKFGTWHRKSPGATICGALLGARTHANIPDEYVKRGFIIILVVAAVWMVVKIYL